MVITNGYDEEDIGKMCEVPNDGDKILVTYMGTVWKATSLCNFMTAIEMLLDDDQSEVRANNLSVRNIWPCS